MVHGGEVGQSRAFVRANMRGMKLRNHTITPLSKNSSSSTTDRNTNTLGVGLCRLSEVAGPIHLTKVVLGTALCGRKV